MANYQAARIIACIFLENDKGALRTSVGKQLSFHANASQTLPLIPISIKGPPPPPTPSFPLPSQSDSEKLLFAGEEGEPN